VNFLRFFFTTAVFLFASAFAALADAPKLALIVTNRAYPASIGALENTHKDGEHMAAALTALGFAVVHKRDVDKAAMMSEVTDYIGRLEKAGPEAVGFFYYSGHGAANSKYGENYLIPVAAAITSDAQLPLQAVKLGEIIDSIAATSAKTNFLVFDACRDVPISFAVKSPYKGLRPETQRHGLLVAFATAPGRTASDEGVYAEALADEMQKPGVLATEVFRSVRSRVLAATSNRQFPWIEDGLIENMYFAPPLVGSASSRPDIGLLSPPKPVIQSNQPAPVTDCDLYAASPRDAERRTPGIQFNRIDAAKAVPACETAVQTYPTEKRFGFQLARALDAAKNFIKARHLYSELANGGYTVAITNLGTMYENGEGVEKDRAEAARLYRKAANVGDTGAMSRLGEMYRTGEGIAKDPAEAIRLYRKAADLGDTDAMTELGDMYRYGLSVAKNPTEAIRLYRRAADQGDADAINRLGVVYSNGEGVAQDKAEAARLYKEAADLGNARAMRNLAASYDKGEGLKEDRKRAAELIISAIKNDPSAEQSKYEDVFLFFGGESAPYVDWSEAFRKELQQLLKQDGFYTAQIDGKASDALKRAVLALAAKSKSGG
jgi:uncharacterized protein